MARIRTEEYKIQLTWVEKDTAKYNEAHKLDPETLSGLEESITELIGDDKIVVDVVAPNENE